MKIFNQEEQGIIRRLLASDGFSRNFLNLIDSRTLVGVRVLVDTKNLSARFWFESDGNSPSEAEFEYMFRRYKEISELVILYLGLFRYLEHNDLAVSYTPALSNPDEVVFGMGDVNRPFHELTFIDKTIPRLIAEYYLKEIIPSHTLRILVENDFVSEDEKRFQSQIKSTWTAIVVSIVIGVASIFY